MDKHLHIITHDVPWPVDYGGVTDLFYKIKWLWSLGINIHLHCFTNTNNQQDELNKYCLSVKYYKRKKNVAAIFFGIPYIVKSRADNSLLNNLKADDYPILMEGIHCTYFLQTNKLSDRKVFVRLHNVEYTYYNQLAKHERNIFKKLYFTTESMLLKNYERRLANKAYFLAVAASDKNIYENLFHARHIHMLPVFLPWDKIKALESKGSFCLYHGNLSVNENENAARWLLLIFKGLDIPLVIAGKNPSLSLQRMAKKHSNTCLVANPTETDMQDLIQKAQVNILPSFNKTGIKLKLMNALYNGRHCLVNAEAAEATGVPSLCKIAKSPEEFRKDIKILFETLFTQEITNQRNEALQQIYSNEKNARQLIAWIY